MLKNKTNIVIAGKQFTITSDESGEYVTRCAYYLDQRVKQSMREFSGQSTISLLSLSALNITDELLKARDSLKAAEARVEELEHALREMQIGSQIVGDLTSEQIEIRRLREANRRLEQENAALRQPKEQKVTALNGSTW